MGTVQIVDCTGEPGDYRWHLARPDGLAQPSKAENHPQPERLYPCGA
jgi:hypothetical protein